MRPLMLLTALACQGGMDPDVTGDTGGDELPPEVDSPYNRADRQAIRGAALSDLSRVFASGVQIAVWLDGAIVYEGQFGSAHPERDVEITAETLFQIGSDTKKIAAVSLLQQVEAGRLSLDDTIATALPGVSLEANPAWATTATLEDLLTHQSGLFNYTPWDEAPDDAELASRATEELSEGAYQLMPPRTAWNYSNAGFSLAGLAAEVADGRAWPDLVEQDIFAPLGMNHSFARRAPVLASDDRAAGFGLPAVPGDPFDPFEEFDTLVPFETVEDGGLSDNAFTRPAGLAWSTATDMARFGGFLIDGDATVLADDLREALTTEQVSAYDAWRGYGYGYGLIVIDGFNTPSGYYEVPLWQHGGNTLAMTSAIYILPEQRLSISVLSNGFNDVLGETAAELIERADVLGIPSGVPDIDTSEAPVSELVGTYVDRNIGTIVVTDEDGDVGVSLPDLDKAGLNSASRLIFGGVRDVYQLSIANQPLEVVFSRDDEGNAEYLYNRIFAAKRQDEVATARSAPVTVDTRELTRQLLQVQRRPLFTAVP